VGVHRISHGAPSSHQPVSSFQYFPLSQQCPCDRYFPGGQHSLSRVEKYAFPLFCSGQQCWLVQSVFLPLRFVLQSLFVLHVFSRWYVVVGASECGCAVQYWSGLLYIFISCVLGLFWWE